MVPPVSAPHRSNWLRRSLIVLAFAAVILGALRWRHMSQHGASSTLAADNSNTLVIAQPADADTLDPSDIASTDALNIARLIYGTLYSVAPDGTLHPYFAESSHFAEDGHSITFQIRPGLRCEDGEPLMAKDVAYSFDRAADRKLAFTGNSTGFVLPAIGYLGSRVDGPLTVTLLVKKYNPIANGLLSEMMIMCRAPYERMTKEQAATHPVASGPYRLAEWLHDDRVVLERNRNFTLPAPHWDRVVWRVIPEASTRSAELIAGNVDIVTNVTPDQINAINASDTAHVESVESVRRIYVGFNQKPKFSNTPGGRAIKDPAVRHALEFAVDVPAICESLLLTPCKRMATLITPSKDRSGIAPYPYDPDRAERLLDAAGYPRGKDGVRFSLTLQAPRGRYLEDSNVALAIGQYLSDIGVPTDVQILDYSSVYAPLVRQRDAGPLFLLGTGGATWSQLYDMSDLASVDSGVNYTNWSDPAFFDGWQALDAARDPVQQQSAITRMMRVFAERGPWLFLYCQPDIYGVSRRIRWLPRADEQITLN